jgi:hypothetical protein
LKAAQPEEALLPIPVVRPIRLYPDHWLLKKPRSLRPLREGAPLPAREQQIQPVQ